MANIFAADVETVTDASLEDEGSGLGSEVLQPVWHEVGGVVGCLENVFSKGEARWLAKHLSRWSLDLLKRHSGVALSGSLAGAVSGSKVGTVSGSIVGALSG